MWWLASTWVLCSLFSYLVLKRDFCGNSVLMPPAEWTVGLRRGVVFVSVFLGPFLAVFAMVVWVMDGLYPFGRIASSAFGVVRWFFNDERSAKW